MLHMFCWACNTGLSLCQAPARDRLPWPGLVGPGAGDTSTYNTRGSALTVLGANQAFEMKANPAVDEHQAVAA